MVKTILYSNLHFWPAGDPLICTTCCCLACGGPDEWGVRAIRIVTVGVAPGVDEVVGGVGGFVGFDHSGFGFEVAFGGGSCREFVRSDKVAEQSGCFCGFGNCGGAGGADGVSTVIGVVAVACGLEGSDFGFGGRVGTVSANGSRGTEGEPCEDADDGDDSEEFDQGEGGHGAERDEGVKGEREDFIWESEMRNSEFEKRKG